MPSIHIGADISQNVYPLAGFKGRGRKGKEEGEEGRGVSRSFIFES